MESGQESGVSTRSTSGCGMCCLVVTSIALTLSSVTLLVLLTVYDYTGFGDGRIGTITSCPTAYLTAKYTITTLSYQQQTAMIANCIAAVAAITDMLLVLAWSGKRCALPNDITRKTKSVLIAFSMLAVVCSIPALGYCADWIVEMRKCEITGGKLTEVVTVALLALATSVVALIFTL